MLIVRDDTNKTFTHKQYTDLSAAQADEKLYTADNYAAICDLLGFAPYQAHVFRADSDGALADTLAEIGRTVKTGWLAIAGQSAGGRPRARGVGKDAGQHPQEELQSRRCTASPLRRTTCTSCTS